MCNRLDVAHERWRKKMSLLSLCLKGNCFTRVSEECLSVVQKGLVPSNTVHCNKWPLNNFESWRSQVASEESCPDDVLLTDDPRLLYFVLAFVSTHVCYETRKANGKL